MIMASNTRQSRNALRNHLLGMENTHLWYRSCHFIHLKLFWILSKWLLGLDGSRASLESLMSREPGRQKEKNGHVSNLTKDLMNYSTKTQSQCLCASHRLEFLVLKRRAVAKTLGVWWIHFWLIVVCVYNVWFWK